MPGYLIETLQHHHRMWAALLQVGRMEVVIVFPDQSKLSPPRDKDAGKRFVKEWSGVLKGVDIEGWKEQRIADLEKKHQ